MTRLDLINTLRQGCKITPKLVAEILVQLDMAGHMEQSLKYYQGEVQRLEDILAQKGGEMSNVYRFDMDFTIGMFEDEEGGYVRHSDYAALLARHNELETRIKQINVWAECDKCGCLFIPGGKGSETTCATCIKEELAALVGAVAWSRECEDCDQWAFEEFWVFDDELTHICAAARAEVDRLLSEAGNGQK